MIFNKIDTYTSEQEQEVDYLAALYSKIGYKTIKISATKRLNINKIESMMENKLSMFFGHSGVGKSTLINTIAPNLNLKTSDISNHHQQGIHTTTFSEIFSLPRGMKLIDTPGIKGFGVVDMQAEEIGNYFPEFLSLKSECKFHNCLHQREPQCAVIQAFEEGNIAESRYKSYLQMLENDITFR